ncbi:MAG TPA: DUF3151 family protein, partial [Acidimicrobiales bacterium]
MFADRWPPDRRGVAALVVLVVALVAAGVVVVPRLLGAGGPDPDDDARAFLAAWQEGDLAAMRDRIVDPPDTFEDDYAQLTDGLAVTSATYELDRVTRDGDDAIARFDATLELGGLGEWSYAGALSMRRSGDGWAVDWSPATVHPQLGEGQHLVRTRAWADRAAITGADGQPLVQARAAVTVGIEPRRMQDRAAVTAALQEQLGVDPADVAAALDAPGVQPDHFVPVVTVPEDRYQAVRPVLYPIPGLLFQETTLRGGPTEGYARHVLGRTGEITAELLEELGPTYAAGDVVGLTGLEARFEQRLAGTPSGEVQAVDAEGEVVTVIDEIAGTAPQPVATTIDPAVQGAVESALAGVTSPAAIVVVDADGNVRGVASRPLDDDLNRALAGAYPPGSTSKVVTTTALVAAGTTPDTPVDCPPTVSAGGRSFRNFESESLGTVPFGTAFAESCNTAFINASAPVPAADLVSAAELFGFNADYSVGLNTTGGSYPEPADDTEKAAAAIGQARITASPLHMATVAAAVVDGSWEPPTLLPDEPEPRQLLEAHVAPVEVAAHYPTHSAAWAALADAAFERGDVVESYAYARVGYHRGLDALRRNGWKG